MGGRAGGRVAGEDERLSRKAAPRRAIVEIVKTGSWGRVEYRHRLECGHTEVRKRASSAPAISCLWCVVAEKKDEELRNLVVQTPVRDVIVEVGDLLDDGFGADTLAAEDASRMVAGLSSALGVPSDSIDVVMEDVDGVLQVQYAVVFLDVRSVRRLSGIDKSN